jgi:hypothetical protein
MTAREVIKKITVPSVKFAKDKALQARVEHWHRKAQAFNDARADVEEAKKAVRVLLEPNVSSKVGDGHYWDFNEAGGDIEIQIIKVEKGKRKPRIPTEELDF